MSIFSAVAAMLSIRKRKEPKGEQSCSGEAGDDDRLDASATAQETSISKPD